MKDIIDSDVMVFNIKMMIIFMTCLAKVFNLQHYSKVEENISLQILPIYKNFCLHLLKI